MQISDYFKLAIERRASDLHLVAGSIPSLRIDGELVKIGQEILNKDELREAIFSVIGENIKERFANVRELDFSQEFFDSRFRINLHYQEGKIALTARHISADVPTPEQLGFNETIYGLTHLKDGLIIITGPSGSGKSTTLAAMVDIINAERRAHVITIEDPIEYYFKEKQSIIEQREVAHDTTDFASALKFALRQDPNVIMVGEMRDLETINAALTAAETGHLILSTLHTNSAPETIKRITSVFPTHQQNMIRYQLSSILRAVISQQLLPRVGGGRVAAREIMINNSAAANLIRDNKISQLYTVIQTGHKEGMITMNKAIENLFKAGKISEITAKNRKIDPEKQSAYY